MSIAIDVRAVVKTFGTFTAVKGISFGVEDGEIFGLLGPNGAGKSTLIRMMTTLMPPTSGTVVVNGFDVATRADDVRRAPGVALLRLGRVACFPSADWKRQAHMLQPPRQSPRSIAAFEEHPQTSNLSRGVELWLRGVCDLL